MMRTFKVISVLFAFATLVQSLSALEDNERQHKYCLTTPEISAVALARQDYQRRHYALSAQRFDATRVQDYGNIAVVEATQDSGIFFKAARFDLKGRSIKFTYNQNKTYDVDSGASKFDRAGSTLALDDADTASVDLDFSFPFFGKNYRKVNISRDGNITLGSRDSNRAPGNNAEAVSGRFDKRARIAVLYTDFIDGELSVSENNHRLLVTWQDVRQPTTGAKTNTFQAHLHESGDIEFHYTNQIEATNIQMGLVPPRQRRKTANFIDFTKDLPVSQLKGLILEGFPDRNVVEPGRAVQQFVASHPDAFDTVVVWTSGPELGILPPRACCAYAVKVKNEFTGIGFFKLFQNKHIFGERLQNYLVMDDLTRYPSNPLAQYGGANPMIILSHEMGHNWTAFPRIIENGIPTYNLLDDNFSHWQFYFDTDASFMFGNEIQENPNGSFTTTGKLRHFSDLDLYFMGLLPPESVGSMFYVANPTGGPNKSSFPQTNVNFAGRRTGVMIDQIIAAEGLRLPGASNSQRLMNVAFLLIVKEGERPSATLLNRMERYQPAFRDFFSKSTGNRMAIYTNLTGGTVEGTVRFSAGTPNPDAQVSIQLSGVGLVENLNTSKLGKYTLQVLPPGEYEITATSKGKDQTKKIKISGTETVTVDFSF